jgi:mycothiol synthase
MDEKLPQLLMYRNLEKLPDLILPGNIKIVTFEDGYEKHWEHIIKVSFTYFIAFDECLRKDTHFKPARVFFALVDGVPAATATAWHDRNYGSVDGYLHMVGALPEFKGNKLGYFVSLAVMHKLKSEGYTNVLLTTDDFRIPAIVTYLRLGFNIDLTSHESIPGRWAAIQQIINN